ncbi:hypothetical protein Glo7428_3646 [Gloeocapsa sp. PCC 7428]|uniref:hypothetical protein n=1 Tax=Gloeocapsa sp. PCC 7428 TaxID=1173026 RepID=UPI0002A60642|nr:hypothetical protein [Gloeocapsa sp. PCC 7428]AFZ32112.1 hypothetical protein Glo7428_3646 [Gloeocapsa sp. PCC 7428]
MTLQRQGKKEQEIDLFFISLRPKVLLQISTGPMLLAMLGARAYSELIQSIGQSAEEILRGDRLPVLPFPEPQKIEQIE